MAIAPSGQAFFTSIAADLSDSAADRRIYLAAGGLALLGVVMTVATAWWWRATRPEDPVLGPLETMSRRRWRTADDAQRGRLLAASRPASDGDGWSADPAPLDLAETASAPLPTVDELLVSLGVDLDRSEGDPAGDDIARG